MLCVMLSKDIKTPVKKQNNKSMEYEWPEPL